MPDRDWPPRCCHCDARIGLNQLAGVVDGEGFVVAATTMELRADPRRYRGRAVHLACVEAAGPPIHPAGCDATLCGDVI